jgi:PAS domain S-box-containing protein
MRANPKKNDRSFNSILITGIAIACIYWVLESFMFFFLDPKANFIQHLLGPDMFETWTRILVLCLFAIFGSHIQYTVNQEREAAEALRLSEEKHRSILENIEEGYFETDLLGNITFLSPPLCRILGYPAEELMGVSTQKFTTEPAANSAETHLDKVMRTGEPTVVPDFDVIQKDGATKGLELSISQIRDGGRRPTGFRYVVRDVSERRRAEEERKRLEIQLQAAQKMEAIGTLAGGIAHDFNNILMGIQGNASLLDLRLDPAFPGREKIRNIEKYIESGTELSSRLLGFARRGKYDVKASDINGIITKSASMFGRAKKEIRVHTQLAEDVLTVEVDRGQIEQALLNLYINAWQAMPDGGDLYLTTENVSLDESFTRPYAVAPGRYVKTTVSDTGLGIDKKDIGRVFEPFFTTKPMGRGIGLGLASVYGIIKGHVGHIDVYSEKGQGTTFTFYLPASARALAEEAPPVAPAIRRGGRETILLVDDEEMIIDVGRGLLQELGYQVIGALSGQEALDLYRARQPEVALVIMDMVMPGMGGSETFDRLKGIDPKAKVLLCSGYSLNGQASKIMQRGCDGFIQKPFNLSQLSVKIREILEGPQNPR